MNKPKGGRGKKAPYEQTHIRIPLPIKDRVEELKEMFLNGYLESHDELLKEDYRKAREYENTLTTLDKSVDSTAKPLTSLTEAIQQSKNILRGKKSARESIAKLLTILYDEEVKPNDLI